MSSDVEDCFRRIIENRKPPKVEPMVDGKVGFIYFDKKGNIMYSNHWEKYFKHVIEKYNKTHKVQMKNVTPHVCRHTYASRLAASGISPKHLQYLMGHADVGTSLNIYSHIHFEDAKNELERLFPEKYKNAMNE